MKKAHFFALFTLIALIVSGCSTESLTPVQNPNDKETPATEIDAGTEETTKPVIKTAEYGVLVTAPESTVKKEEIPPRELGEVNGQSSMTTAEAVFVAPGEAVGGRQYTVAVFAKEPTETYAMWIERNAAANLWVSDRTVPTREGRTAYLYDTDDYGGLPDITAFIVTRNFVYKVSWNNLLIEGMYGEDAMDFVEKNPSLFKYKDVYGNPTSIPLHFIEFVQSLAVQD